jgi:general secretion pathway protein K
MTRTRPARPGTAHPPNTARWRTRGAALLAALFTAALVTSLAGMALWKHWQMVERESAARQQQQAQWVMRGAIDWARLILREDARDNNVDHLSEPWAVPLREAKLDNFLGIDAGREDSHFGQARLSGTIIDAQARMNLANLLDGKRISEQDLREWQHLFRLLDLPTQELNLATQRYLQSMTGTGNPGESPPLPPVRWTDWGQMGFSPATLAALQPHAVFLPEPTRINLNTASQTVLLASFNGIDPALTRQIVEQRNLSPIQSLEQFLNRYPAVGAAVRESRHGVASKYFLVTGQVQLQGQTLGQSALLWRDHLDVRVLRLDADCPPAPLCTQLPVH